MKNGKTDVTIKLQTFDCGKNISVTQNGTTPKFNHKYIISVLKNAEICSIITKNNILHFL
tara:strand:- start:601 stop:780 length:180 start_codon:yes stop_codon:yes gene_type:complete